MLAGRKPKPTALKVLEGNPGKRALVPDPLQGEGSPTMPSYLDRPARRLWRRYIDRAWWLTWADEAKAAAWCALQARFEADPGGTSAAHISQLRALGSELGFDPASRARIGATAEPATGSKFDGLYGVSA